MNYLAHALLARGEPEWIVGSMIADWRPHASNLPPGVILGIELHQVIDSACDRHSDFHSIRDELRPAAGLYAGVMTDIICDNLLIDSWEKFSGERLNDFTSSVYASLKDVSKYSEVPFAPKEGKEYPDWLSGYGDRAGLARAISRVRMKVKSERRFPDSTAVLDLYFSSKAELLGPFEKLFQDLINTSEEFKAQY